MKEREPQTRSITKDALKSTTGRDSRPRPTETYTDLTPVVTAVLHGEPIPEEYNSIEKLCKSSKKKQNLIHLTIEAVAFENEPKSKQAVGLVQEVALENPDLLVAKDIYKKTPLAQMPEHYPELLFAIIDLLVLPRLHERIQVTCSDENTERCPLYDVHPLYHRSRVSAKRSTGLSDTDSAIGDFEDLSNGSPTTLGNGTHDRCLHDQLNVSKLLQKSDKLRATVIAGLAQILNDGDQSALNMLLDQVHLDSAHATEAIPLDDFKALLQLIEPKEQEATDKDGYSPLHKAISLYDKDSIAYENLYCLIERLVEHHPEAIYVRVSHRHKSHQNKMALSLLHTVGLSEKDEVRSIAIEKTESLLKRVCVGSRKTSWEKRKEFLYSGNVRKARQICLNLSAENRLFDTAYIQKIRKRSGMEFESAVEFVKLPYWNPPLINGTQMNAVSENIVKPELLISDPYPDIFDWLADKNVGNIFAVEVDDMGPQPHSNNAIRRALRGDTESPRDFHIEVFDWRKFDLCAEVILYTAPNAKEVYLYSSGNTAVLRGWACDPCLSKLKNLQKLTIEVQATTSCDEDDCKAYESEMVELIRKRCIRLSKEYPIINYTDTKKAFVSNDVPESTVSQHGQNNQATSTLKPDQWIQELYPFKSFLDRFVRSNRPSIKVALLDDGVKLDVDALNGKHIGDSFRPDKAAFFAGPCIHGTDMARFISKVCPRVKLYMARLDDSRKEENQTFTTQSACEQVLQALEWAEKMEVDIVSMSWSFELKLERPDHERFKTIVQRIVQAGKPILFASLPDENSATKTSTYVPVELSGVIPISSATVYGRMIEENMFANPEFLLPGEDVHVDGMKTPVKGSSYATAYAAGLAALVLYFLSVHHKLEASDDEGVPGKERLLERRLEKARTTDGMRTIFRALSRELGTSEKKKLFVRPAQIFNSLREDFAEPEEEARRQMDIIASKLQLDD